MRLIISLTANMEEKNENKVDQLLPKCILDSIFNFLEIKQRIRLSRVCKQFYAIAFHHLKHIDLGKMQGRRYATGQIKDIAQKIVDE